MMKERTKGFITGILVSMILFLLAGGALAASQSIDVSPIKILVNGEEFRPKDANGNDVLVFTYNGTTYAPLRALAEAFGLEVGYDSAANMATVGQTPADAPAGQLQPAVQPQPQPDVQPQSQPDVQSPAAPSNSRKIYVTATGKRYHYSSSCNGGTYYESTLEDAVKRGLTPCNKCVS